MNKNIKITVATVTYNAGTLLERTIKSVEEQDYPNVEHVIVDGNSTDQTLELIHQYQERNGMAEQRHEINILSEPDKGLYDAMNKAIHMATGKYILFLNAGDKLHSTQTLGELVNATQEGKAGVVYGHTDIVDEEGNFLRKRRLAPPEKLTVGSFKAGMVVCHQAFLARLDLAARNPYLLKYRFSADYDWCIRIMKASKKANAPLVNARIVVADYLDGGLTTKNHNKSLRERFRIMAKHYGLVQTLALHAFFAIRQIYKK